MVLGALKHSPACLRPGLGGGLYAGWLQDWNGLLGRRALSRAASPGEKAAFGECSQDDRPTDKVTGLNFDSEEAGFQNSHYIPLSAIQKAILAVGSGVSSFFDPSRADSIATFGEVTAEPALRYMLRTMKNDPEGADVLACQPRINSQSINLEALAKLPEGTLGRTYYEFLRVNNVTPDSRLPVRFIEDPELAYVMQRYREVHDLIHTVTGQPTNMLGEVVVKWIEGIQTGLPMCVTGGVFGATRLRPKQRRKYVTTYLPWAIQVGLNSRLFLNVFYERRWEDSIEDLRNQISPLLNKPPAV